MRDIRKETLVLDKERRDLMSELMMPHEEYFRLKRLDIMNACEEQGHKFRFTDFGPLGHAWYHCIKCGKSKVENND